MSEPLPPGGAGPGREPPPGGARSGGEPSRGLSNRAKAGAGAFIAVLYAVGMAFRGDVLPGVVGGVLAGVLCFLVLREVEQQRRRRRS